MLSALLRLNGFCAYDASCAAECTCPECDTRMPRRIRVASESSSQAGHNPLGSVTGLPTGLATWASRDDWAEGAAPVRPAQAREMGYPWCQAHCLVGLSHYNLHGV